eukprot:179271-Chlamydomonas_euryale.AAC.1
MQQVTGIPLHSHRTATVLPSQGNRKPTAVQLRNPHRDPKHIAAALQSASAAFSSYVGSHSHRELRRELTPRTPCCSCDSWTSRHARRTRSLAWPRWSDGRVTRSGSSALRRHAR